MGREKRARLRLRPVGSPWHTPEWVAAKKAELDAKGMGLTIRYGIEVQSCKSRGDLLADGAGAWAYAIAAQSGCQRLLYDGIGVGAGAAASLRDKRDIRIDPWNAAGAVVRHKYLGSRAHEDMFANAKAQAWWELRDCFLETFKASKGEAYDRDAIISLSPAIEELRELKSEFSQVTYVQRRRQGPRQQGSRRPRFAEPSGLRDDRLRPCRSRLA